MSTVIPRTAKPSFIQGWFSDRKVLGRALLNVGIALFVGWLLGQQIYRPSPRIIKGLVGLGVLYAAWRFPIPVSLSAFLILFPFPFAITYGSSNTIFVFLITAMWFAQIVLRSAQPVGRTMLDLPIVILIGAYLLSFKNVTNAASLGGGLVNLSTIVAGIFVFYLIVHSVRDESTLRRIVRIITVTATLTYGVALWELAFPGRPLIKGWILTSPLYLEEAIQRGLRVGGPFGDFELYAEFCALMFPIFLFHLLRARRSISRALWGGLTFLNFFVLMATVTRGATIALVAGMVYLLYRLRRGLSFRQFTMTVTLSVCIWSAVEFYLSHYTVSGSVMDRLLNTKIVGGLPDSRSFWPLIVERIKEHPWVGHGPYYEFGEQRAEELRRYFWPHNGYLYYLHTVGLLGTSAFLWILGRLFITTGRKCLNSLTEVDYSRSLLLVLNVALVIFAVDQLKIEYLRNQQYQFFPWILFGLSVATLNIVEKRNLETSAEHGPLDGAKGRWKTPMTEPDDPAFGAAGTKRIPSGFPFPGGGGHP